MSDSYALSTQIVTTAEKMAKAKDWARLLFDVIPENKLQDCFDAARIKHNSPFAISGYELEAVYRAMPEQESEFDKQYAEAEKKWRASIPQPQSNGANANV